MSDGAKLWRRTVRRLTWSVAIANGLGGLLMFLLLGFLVPFAPDGPDRHLAVNAIVAGVYLPVSLWAGTVFALRRGKAIERWLDSGLPPTPEERRRVLRSPAEIVAISAGFWTIAAIIFTAINVPTDGWAALVVGGAMLLGGETTCAVTYLLHERIIRPVTVLALAGAAAPERTGPGVSGR